MKRGVLLLIGVVFLVVLGVFMFIAARGGSKQPTQAPVVKVWAPFDEKKVYDELSKTFLSENPGVSVEFEYIAAADAKEYEAKVVDRIASGEGPDIWLIRTDWLPKHAAKLSTMPVGLGWTKDKKETDTAALERLLSKSVVAQNSVSGGMYGIPLSVDSLALYVNETVLTQVRRELSDRSDAREEILQTKPATWTELEEWARLITVRSARGITRPAIALGTVDNTYAATDVYTALLQQYGGAIYNTPEEIALHLALGDGSIPATRALEFFTSFSNKTHPNYSWDSTLGDPVDRFAKNELALMIGYSTLRPELLRKGMVPESFSLAPLPQRQAVILPTDERVDFAASWTHVVPKSGSNQTLAWKYLKSLTIRETQAFYTKQTLKATLSEADATLNSHKLSPTSSENTNLFALQAMNARPILKPDWQVVDAEIQAMIRSVEGGVLAAQAAVDTTAQRLKDAR